MQRSHARNSGRTNRLGRGSKNPEGSLLLNYYYGFPMRTFVRRIGIPLLIALLTFIGPHVRVLECLAATEPPPEGGVLPEVRLPAPGSSADRDYLGLNGKGFFRIPEIKAEVVIVEIFSMYCPYCQKEAPNVNKLFQTIQERSDLKKRVKIIGIGAGNTEYEVNLFKDRYKIPFPLFPDPDYSIHQILGEVRTPYFIAIQINRDGSHKVIYSQLSSFGDPEDFLKLLLKRSGIKGGA